jgi:3-methyladenine DNA glycosylase AlkD
MEILSRSPGAILLRRENSMNRLIETTRSELEALSKTAKEAHLKTGDIRRLSSKLYHSLQDKSKDHVFTICEALLEEHSWPMGVIAYDFAYRVRKQYDDNTFYRFESWLIKYVRGWGDCDDFCTHAFGELLSQNTQLFERILPWTKREEFWMRRAAAVILIPSIHHDTYKEINPLQISDLLMSDEHDLVRKGYGWMLKVLSVKEPRLVYDYLIKNVAAMPRVAFRYALEKLDQDKKAALMSL